ncbi:hypothetical protein FD755_021710, partial [Muntiacus reevesi]
CCLRASDSSEKIESSLTANIFKQFMAEHFSCSLACSSITYKGCKYFSLSQIMSLNPELQWLHAGHFLCPKDCRNTLLTSFLKFLLLIPSGYRKYQHLRIEEEWKGQENELCKMAQEHLHYFLGEQFSPAKLLCLESGFGQSDYSIWCHFCFCCFTSPPHPSLRDSSLLTFLKDPGKYLHTCPESVKKWLRQLKNAGKILMLITSSHSDYCRLLCEYILGNDFEDLFDIVITNALKPGFFSHLPSQRPFRTLENDEEREALPSLDKPGWYSQGNAVHLYELLKKMTGKPEPKVVYFGDSMHSDIFPACHYSNWETVLILEELRGDKDRKPEESEPEEKKGKYEGSKAKPLNTSSKKWGSFFIDSVSGLENTEDSLVYTWSCKRISAYSTIAIPSIEAIAELPLDYKFTRFSSNNSKTAGYYPNPPLVLSNAGKLTAK